MQYHELLTRIGLEPKASTVYLALLSLGPSPVRKIAVEAKINRGTTHQLLKELIDQGLVSYYHKQKRQYFIAEGPEKLLSLAQQKLDDLGKARDEIEKDLPTLKALGKNEPGKTIVRSYEGKQGIRTVLEEVLDVLGDKPNALYRAYSSSTIRDVLYQSFPSYTKERILRQIAVRVIAIGSGGEHQDLAERRWLATEERIPTYRLIYSNRIAVISQSSQNGELRAIVIEDPAIYQTEIILFDQLWEMLKPKHQ